MISLQSRSIHCTGTIISEHVIWFVPRSLSLNQITGVRSTATLYIWVLKFLYPQNSYISHIRWDKSWKLLTVHLRTIYLNMCHSRKRHEPKHKFASRCAHWGSARKLRHGLLSPSGLASGGAGAGYITAGDWCRASALGSIVCVSTRKRFNRVLFVIAGVDLETCNKPTMHVVFLVCRATLCCRWTWI